MENEARTVGAEVFVSSGLMAAAGAASTAAGLDGIGRRAWFLWTAAWACPISLTVGRLMSLDGGSALSSQWALTVGRLIALYEP